MANVNLPYTAGHILKRNLKRLHRRTVGDGERQNIYNSSDRTLDDGAGDTAAIQQTLIDVGRTWTAKPISRLNVYLT